MTDRFFLATLTLGVLLAGLLTISSALIDGATRAPMRVRVVELEPVTVTAKRLRPPATVAAAERVEPAAQRAQ